MMTTARTRRPNRLGAAFVLAVLALLVAPLPVLAEGGAPVPNNGVGVARGPAHPGQESPGETVRDLQTAGEGSPNIAALASMTSAEPRTLTMSAAAAVDIPPPGAIDMRVLVIHTEWEQDFEVKGITGALDRIGVPYDLLNAETTDLTPDLLFDETGHGFYYAVVLTTGNLLYWDEALGAYVYGFNEAEWNLLWAYEAAFGVRQATSFTAPVGFPESYGLNWAGEMDTTTVPLPVSLTPAGEEVFSYLTDAPIPIQYAWVYLATVNDSSVTTPLIVADDYAIASVTAYPDGRENMAVTVAKNDWALHSLLLWSGMIDWATRGVYLGERHVNFDAQVDDLLIHDDRWIPATLSNDDDFTNRLTADELDTLIAWQDAFRVEHPLAADVQLEFGFNDEGATGVYEPDTLTPAVIDRESAFSWVNHSYSHMSMDAPTTFAQARIEIKKNDRMAKRPLGFENYVRASFIQPDITGLENPAFLHAAAANGVRYLISDASRPEWDNPSPNTGFILPVEPRLLIIPRRANNLFYNVVTPEEWVSEYNCYYGPFATCGGGEWQYWDHNLTYEEIIDVESNMLLSYLLKWDLDPLMFHQANLRDYEGGASLLGDLIDATFDKYDTYYTLPVRGLHQHEIGREMLDRMRYEAVDVDAEIIPCVSLTLTSPVDVTIPVTGVYIKKKFTELYGDDFISDVGLKAGVSRTIPVSCTP